MTSYEKILVSLINFLSQTGCRQKICRLVQYFCKFLSCRFQDLYDIQISQRSQIKKKITKADSLQGSMALARKIFRFGPSLNCIKIFITNLMDLAQGRNQESASVTILKTLSAFFLSMYFVCDHYLWFFKMGLIQNQTIKAHCDYFSTLGWLLDCITGIVKNIVMYLELSSKERESKGKDIAIDLLRVVLDTPVAYSFFKPGSVNGLTAGKLGTMTSIISIYQLWK